MLTLEKESSKKCALQEVKDAQSRRSNSKADKTQKKFRGYFF